MRRSPRCLVITTLALGGIVAGVAAEHRSSSLQVSVVVTRSCQLSATEAGVSAECGASSPQTVQVTVGDQSPLTTSLRSSGSAPGQAATLTVPRPAGQSITIDF
jgi:hypothetical protein